MAKAAELRSIVVIGAGKLASALAFALHRNGFRILQVVNRSEEKAKKLAMKYHATFTSEFRKTERRADLYLLAVSDDAIGEVASRLGKLNGLVVHASGSVDASVLKPFFRNYGVFYPLQTFAGKKIPDFRTIPVCIEGNTRDNATRLTELANRLSGRYFILDSSERKMVHLAAVMVNNFPNYLFSIAEELMIRHGLPFDILHPLILRTARNAGDPGVFSRQTGPAAREDSIVIGKHLEMLGENPEYRKIYKLLTESIIKKKRSDDKL
jgi:predicted short-subunit dehydrogenase-like oxidoreductase (DUF2520 family)